MRTYKVLLARRRVLRLVRAERGVTYRSIAEAIGQPDWLVRHVMLGMRISNQVAEALAAYFNEPVPALFVEMDLENPPDDAEAERTAMASLKRMSHEL